MDAPSGTSEKMCEDDENDEALVQKWRGSVPTSISMHRAEVCSVVPQRSYFVLSRLLAPCFSTGLRMEKRGISNTPVGEERWR